jgi:hypothetical protein
MRKRRIALEQSRAAVLTMHEEALKREAKPEPPAVAAAAAAAESDNNRNSSRWSAGSKKSIEVRNSIVN